MYIWGYQTPVFIPSGQKNLIFSEIFPFLGNKCTFGGTKLQFLSHRVKKNFIFSEIFPFLGNKCTFGATKLQFLSPSGQKNFIFSEIFFIFREQMYIWGYQTPVFIPIGSKKNLIF